MARWGKLKSTYPTKQRQPKPAQDPIVGRLKPDVEPHPIARTILTKINLMRATSALQPIAQPALTCLALLLILFSRRPEMFLNPQLWAEDGLIFFLQADADGAQALLTPFSGYHHLLLRIIAAVAAPLNAVVLPAGYFYASMAVTIMLAAALFSPRIQLSFRPACALALGLLPHTGEVFGNLTNLQWLAALGLVWLLLASDATRPWQHIGDMLTVTVLGLTGVFSVLFTPLFLYRAGQRRSLASAIIAGLLACAALVQAVTIYRTGSDTLSSETAWSFLHTIEVIGLRLIGSLCIPLDQAMRLPLFFTIGLGAVTGVGLICAACWPGQQRDTRLLLVACIGLIIAGTLFRFSHEPTALDVITDGDRYFFLPKLLIAWLLIQGLADTGWRRWACAGMCLAALTTSLSNWRYARFPDRDWPSYARRIEAGENVTAIPLNPDWTFSHPGRHHLP